MKNPTTYDILNSVLDISNEAMIKVENEGVKYTKDYIRKRFSSEYVCYELERRMEDKKLEINIDKASRAKPIKFLYYWGDIPTSTDEVSLYNYPSRSGSIDTAQDVTFNNLSDFVVYNLFLLFCGDYHDRCQIIPDNIISFCVLKQAKHIEYEEAKRLLDEFNPYDSIWAAKFHFECTTPQLVKDELYNNIKEYEKAMEKGKWSIDSKKRLLPGNFMLRYYDKLLPTIKYLNKAGRIGKDHRMIDFKLDQNNLELKEKTKSFINLRYAKREEIKKEKSSVIKWMNKKFGDSTRYHIYNAMDEWTGFSKNHMTAKSAVDHLLLFFIENDSIYDDIYNDVEPYSYIVDRNFIIYPSYTISDKAEYDDDVNSVIEEFKKINKLGEKK